MKPAAARCYNKEAVEEGAARLFKQIAKIESEHAERYKKFLSMVEDGTVYKREQPIKWECSKFGYVLEGTEPLGKCSCCLHSKEYFEPESLSF